MHAPAHLAAYWAVAFLSLGLAVVLLNIYSGWIGNDLELRSAGQEAAIAGVASLVEAASLWLILTFAPGALRAMIFPIVVVAVIYQVSHFQDWNRFHVFMLVVFQVALVLVGGSLVHGYFQVAIAIWVGFTFFLALMAGIMRSL